MGFDLVQEGKVIDLLKAMAARAMTRYEARRALWDLLGLGSRAKV